MNSATGLYGPTCERVGLVSAARRFSGISVRTTASCRMQWLVGVVLGVLAWSHSAFVTVAPVKRLNRHISGLVWQRSLPLSV